jgi:hypothetical protein
MAFLDSIQSSEGVQISLGPLLLLTLHEKEEEPAPPGAGLLGTGKEEDGSAPASPEDLYTRLQFYKRFLTTLG